MTDKSNVTEMTGLPTSAPPGGDYNSVPYVSKPFPQSGPPRLAALATLFGLKPPPVTGARVLELGCASGGNLLYQALRFPGARFRGIDLTERHVRDGQARVAALDLGNIRIEQGDIAALDFGSERFDYIICHGVYSWVPDVVRNAILRLCGQHLSDNGMAYISYNVYPGWHLREVIRDMMAFHAGWDGPPEMRIAKARWVLENIAKSSPAGTTYAAMLREEAKLLSGMESSYILGEFLAEENSPCYFRDFAAAAEGHGLNYLCEADIAQCIPEHISPEVGKLVRTMSANKLIALEQYVDFFRGRTFRQTLLVKTAQSQIPRMLLPDRIRDLHLSARLTCKDKDGGGWTFSSPGGGTLVTQSQAVHRALLRLAEAYPVTHTLAELVAVVRADRNEQAAILDAIFKGVLVGLLEISSVPLRLDPAAATRAKPRAHPLARLDAGQRTGWTANPAGHLIALDVVSTTLLPLMDGSNDRDTLQRALRTAVRDGHIRIQDNATRLDLSGPALDNAIAEHVSRVVAQLAAAGLLG